MRRLTLRALAVSAVAVLTLSGCATGGDKTSTESGAKLGEPGKLTVCTHLPYKPFQFNKGGQVVGFEVDLMDLVAKRLGAQLKTINTPFERIESGQALDTGQCDVAAAGMTITRDRAKAIDFSDPYFQATQALLVKKGSGISGLEDLGGKSLAVQSGTTGEIYAEQNAPEDTEIRTFEDLALLTTAVKTGQVDAGVNDNGVLYDYVQTNTDTAVATEFHTGEEYGFAVRKDQNDALLRTIDQVLAKARSNGTYDQIYRRWFGGQAQG